MTIRIAMSIATLLIVTLLQPSHAGDPASSMPSMPTQATTAGTTAKATGVVKTIDAKAGKITISHGPVAVLRWPAMTMAFKATPAQMAAVHTGQKVDFTFVSKGMDGTLTNCTVLVIVR